MAFAVSRKQLINSEYICKRTSIVDLGFCRRIKFNGKWQTSIIESSAVCAYIPSDYSTLQPVFDVLPMYRVICVCVAVAGGICGAIYVIRKNIEESRMRRINLSVANLAHQRGISLGEARAIIEHEKTKAVHCMGGLFMCPYRSLPVGAHEYKFQADQIPLQPEASLSLLLPAHLLLRV